MAVRSQYLNYKCLENDIVVISNIISPHILIMQVQGIHKQLSLLSMIW